MATRSAKGLVIVLAGLLVGLTSVLAYAMWTAQTTMGAVVTAGDMSLRLGQFSWSCPEQDKSSETHSLSDLVIGPGETLILRQQLTGTLKGDNLAVDMSVAFSSLPAGVTGQWYVEQDAAHLMPASGSVPLSKSLLLPDAPGLDGQLLVVVVSLSYPDGPPVWADPLQQNQPVTSDLGTLTISANQVRCGSGFAVSCAPEADNE